VQVTYTGTPTAPAYTDGPKSSDSTNLEATNVAEWSNTASVGAYGLDITATADSTVTVGRIPNGTVVHMFMHPKSNSTVAHTFEAYNPITVACL